MNTIRLRARKDYERICKQPRWESYRISRSRFTYDKRRVYVAFWSRLMWEVNIFKVRGWFERKNVSYPGVR